VHSSKIDRGDGSMGNPDASTEPALSPPHGSPANGCGLDEYDYGEQEADELSAEDMEKERKAMFG
jgi:hypothetical protein